MHTPTWTQVARPPQVSNSLARQTLPQICMCVHTDSSARYLLQTSGEDWGGGTAPQTQPAAPAPCWGLPHRQHLAASWSSGPRHWALGTHDQSQPDWLGIWPEIGLALQRKDATSVSFRAAASWYKKETSYQFGIYVSLLWFVNTN